MDSPSRRQNQLDRVRPPQATPATLALALALSCLMSSCRTVLGPPAMASLPANAKVGFVFDEPQFWQHVQPEDLADAFRIPPKLLINMTDKVQANNCGAPQQTPFLVELHVSEHLPTYPSPIPTGRRSTKHYVDAEVFYCAENSYSQVARVSEHVTITGECILGLALFKEMWCNTPYELDTQASLVALRKRRQTFSTRLRVC